MAKKKDNEEKELHDKLAEKLIAPPNIPEDEPETDSVPPEIQERKETLTSVAKEQTTQITLSESLNVLPATLQASAQSSTKLRDIQSRLADILTNENYLGLIAGTNPEVLPALLDSVTNAVSVSDNLMIQMARVAEKNSSMNKVFEYLTRQQEQRSTSAGIDTPQQDQYYDESVERIKRAIYQRLDEDRNEHHSTSQDFIEAEYTVSEETEQNED